MVAHIYLLSRMADRTQQSKSLMGVAENLIPWRHETTSLVFEQAIWLVSVQRGLAGVWIKIFWFQFSLWQNNRIILRLIDDKGPHLVRLPVLHPYKLGGITIGPKTGCIHGTASVVVPLTVSYLCQNLLDF